MEDNVLDNPDDDIGGNKSYFFTPENKNEDNGCLFLGKGAAKDREREEFSKKKRDEKKKKESKQLNESRVDILENSSSIQFNFNIDPLMIPSARRKSKTSLNRQVSSMLNPGQKRKSKSRNKSRKQ